MTKTIKFLVLGFAFLSLINCKKSSKEGEISDTSNEVRRFYFISEYNNSNLAVHNNMPTYNSVYFNDYLVMIPANDRDEWQEFYGNEINLESMLESMIYFYNSEYERLPYPVSKSNLVLIPNNYEKGMVLKTLNDQDIDENFLNNMEVPLVYFGISNTFFIPEKHQDDFVALNKKSEQKIRIDLNEKIIERFKKHSPSSFVASEKSFRIVFEYKRRNPIYYITNNPEMTETYRYFSSFNRYLNPCYQPNNKL